MMSLRVCSKRGGLCLALAAVLACSQPTAAQDNAAHKIADSFSNDGAAQRKAEEQRKKEAEAKAQEALREKARKLADEALKAARDREMKAQAAQARKPAAEPVASEPPTPPDQSIDAALEEREMLARARREAAQRHKAEATAQAEAEARKAIEKIIADNAAAAPEEDRAKAVAEARRTWQSSARRIVAHEKQVAEDEERAKVVAEARRAWQQSAQRIGEQEKQLAEAEARAKVVAEARRAWQRSAQRIGEQEKQIAEAEARAKVVAEARRAWQRSAQRIGEQEKQVAEAEARAKVLADALPPAAPKAESTVEPAPPVRRLPALAPQALGARVTVLLVMEPGSRGIRRHNKSADPLLCVKEGCYVSSGADVPARLMPGRQALGFVNTWGGRAGACRNQLGCVFRGIVVTELPLQAQPVDMRVMKHDRRHMATIATDSGCRFDAGRLACARGIVEDDYVMWVIPESLAESAGPAALEQALHDGLTGPQSAHIGGGRL